MRRDCCVATVVAAVRFGMILAVALSFLLLIMSCGEKEPQGNNVRHEELLQEEHLSLASNNDASQAIQWQPVTCWPPSDGEYVGMAKVLFHEIVRNESIIGGSRFVENAIAISEDHSVIALGTERGWVELIDAGTGDLLYILTLMRKFGPPPDEITSLAFSGYRLVATSRTGQITFSDLTTSTVELAETCDGRAGLVVDPIQGVYLYKTMNYIVVRDLQTGRLERKIECFDDGPIVKSLQQPILAMRAVRGGVKLWNTETGEPVLLVRGITTDEAGFTYDSDGIPLPIWKTESVEGGTRDYQVETLVVPSSGGPFTLSRTGKWLAVAEICDQIESQFVLRVWLIAPSAHNTRVIQVRIPYSPSTPRVAALAISANDRLCAIGYGPCFDNQYRVDVWDIEHGEVVDQFTVPSKLMSLKFIGDERLIVVRADSVVEQREIEVGQTLWKYTLHLEYMSVNVKLNWAYSPNGRLIATAGRETLRIWDVNLRRPLWEVDATQHQEFQLPAVSSDSRYIAIIVNHAADDQSSALIIVDSITGHILSLHDLEGYSIEGTALIFSRDNRNLFLAAKDHVYGRNKLLVINRDSGVERILEIGGRDEYYRVVQDDSNPAVLYLLSEGTITAFDLSSDNILWTRFCRERPILLDVYNGRMLVTYKHSVGLNVEILDAKTGQPTGNLLTMNADNHFNFRKGRVQVSNLGTILGMFFAKNGTDVAIAITSNVLPIFYSFGAG